MGLEVKEEVRNCMNCAHRKGSYTFGKCMLSGYYCETERQHPTVCGVNFERWKRRGNSLQISAWILTAIVLSIWMAFVIVVTAMAIMINN
jgi:hypothetical protein